MSSREFLEQAADALREQLLRQAPGRKLSDEFFWTKEHCPCCGKRSRTPGTISGFYWTEGQAIIYYWLCSSCARDLSRMPAGPRGRRVAERIEKTLIDGISQ
ncbi:MAG: hypothetical protein NTW86_21510 [Candidatus Sumerlaeota bacterium]|nr:hypothetical protein [Candidatus Sumerlaeota bacterium]